MTYVRFQMLRVTSKITTPEDLDTAKISYSFVVSHSSCLSVKALPHIVIASEKGSVFAPSIFFHPNVGVDGWADLSSWHRRLRDNHSDLLPFPSEPKFWVLPARGSAVSLWPPSPSFFDHWIMSVANGFDLALDPGASQVAGSSNINKPSPPRSFSRSSSALSEPPPTPPKTPTPSIDKPLDTPPGFPQDGTEFGDFGIPDEALEGLTLEGDLADESLVCEGLGL